MNILETLTAQRRADAIERRQMRRSFAAALLRPGINIIAELKRASPSEGMIREDFHPADLARKFDAGGAAALSVLCEPHRFLGGEHYLREARAVTSLPILYKDFLSTPFQIAEAFAAGADAERPFLLDCHSFPADLAPDVDVCLGWNEDESRPTDDVLGACRAAFERRGFRVAFNKPYGNSILPDGWRGPSMLVELSKAVYLDESDLSLIPRSGLVKQALRDLCSALLGTTRIAKVRGSGAWRGADPATRTDVSKDVRAARSARLFPRGPSS